MTQWPNDSVSCVGLDEGNNFLERTARREDLGDTCLLEPGHVLVGDDPACEDHHVIQMIFPFKLHDAREEMHVSSGEYRKPDGIDVFLQGGIDDLFGSLPEPRVNNFHSGIAKGARNDFSSAIVTIEARFGHENSYSFVAHESYYTAQCSQRGTKKLSAISHQLSAISLQLLIIVITHQPADLSAL